MPTKFNTILQNLKGSFHALHNQFQHQRWISIIKKRAMISKHLKTIRSWISRIGEEFWQTKEKGSTKVTWLLQWRNNGGREALAWAGSSESSRDFLSKLESLENPDSELSKHAATSVPGAIYRFSWNGSVETRSLEIGASLFERKKPWLQHPSETGRRTDWPNRRWEEGRWVF